MLFRSMQGPNDSVMARVASASDDARLLLQCLLPHWQWRLRPGPTPKLDQHQNQMLDVTDMTSVATLPELRRC